MKSEIFDVGCGSGEIDIIIVEKGYSVTAVDISHYAIQLAWKLAGGRFSGMQGEI